MFEGVLTGLINKYLGEFIEGLDAEQLKLGVWGGEINLTNLKVKPSALDFLHLPVGVVAGTVGRFRLKISWRHLWSQPVEVFLEDVSLIACNKDLSAIDETAEAERALAEKLKSLKSVEDLKLSEAYQDAIHGRQKKSSKQGYVGQMISTIIDNIQITVRRVHVRFEHDGTRTPGGPKGERAALGLVLNAFTVRSTDENGLERFVQSGPSATDPTRHITYKKVELTGLAVYFNTQRTGSGNQQATTEDMTNFFDGGEEKCHYLLKPLHGSVNVELNKNEPAEGQPPAVKVAIRLQAFELAIDELQYRALLGILASISRASAVDRIILQRYIDTFRSGTPEERRLYLSLYRRTIAPSWEEHLDAVEAAELTRLEKELTLNNLAHWRAIVFAQLYKQLPDRNLSKRPPPAPATAGLMSRLVGSAVSVAKTVVGRGEGILPFPDCEYSEEDLEEIASKVDENETAPTAPPELPPDAEDVTYLPRSHVSLSLEFEQNTLSFSILAQSRRPLAVFAINETKVAFEQRKQGMMARVRLGNVEVRDHCTPNTLYPEIFSMSRAQREKLNQLAAATEAHASEAPNSPLSPTSAAAPFIDLTYEAQPIDSEVDSRIILSILPSLLVVHNKFISKIVTFFANGAAEPEQRADIVKLWGAHHLQQLRDATKISVKDAFKTHHSMAMQIQIAAPTILVTASPNILQSPVLVLDLGILGVDSKPQSKAVIASLRESIMIKSAANEPSQSSSSSSSSSSPPPSTSPDALIHSTSHVPLLSPQEIAQCYDHLDVRVTDVQLFFSITQSTVGGRGFDSKISSSILPQTTIVTQVQMSIAPEISWMAVMRIVGDISSLDLDLSTTSFHKIMQIAKSFTAPPSTVPPTPHPAASMMTFDSPSSSSSPTSPYIQRLSIESEQAVAAAAAAAVSPENALETKEILTFADLTQLFQSERDARLLLADLDTDGNGEVTRDEYNAWYAKKKQILKHKRGMEVEFRIAQVKVKLIDDQKAGAQSASSVVATPLAAREIVTVTIGSIFFGQEARTFSSKMTVEVGSFTLTDCLTQYPGDFRSIISTNPPINTPSKYAPPSKFLKLTMDNTSTEHPDYATSTMVGSDLLVEVGTLILLVDPHSINNVVIFLLKEFLPKPEPTEAVPQLNAAPTPAAASPTSEKPEFLIQPSTTTAPTVSMRITCSVSLFQLLLTQQGRFVTKFAAQGIATNVEMLIGGGMNVEADINKLALVDMRGVRPIPVLIGIEPADRSAAVVPTLQLAYKQFPPAAAMAFGFQTHVDVKLQSIKIVNDFYFYGSVLTYLFMTLALPFIAGDKQAQPAIAASSSSSASSKEEDEKKANDAAVVALASAPATPALPFLKFTVALDDIELVFPNHKTADPSHKLTFLVRRLEVCNNILYAETPTGRVEYQQFAVGIGGFTLQSAFFPGSEPNSRATTIMHLAQLSIATSMAQAVNSTLDVRIDMSRMDVSLAQENYPFLMDMIFAILDNLQGLTPKPAEPAPAPATTVIPASSAPVASSWIKVYVMIHNMSVELSKCKGWNTSDGIFTLLGREVDVRYTMDSTGPGGMGVEAAFEAMEIVDNSVAEGARVQDVLPEYRRMIGMRDPDTPQIEIMYPSAYLSSRIAITACDVTPLLNLHLGVASNPKGAMYAKWSKLVSGAQVIDLEFQHFYYTICSMVVMEMTTFFVMPPKPEDAASAAALAQAAVAPDQNKELYGSGRRLSAIENASLQLMADPVLTGAIIPYVEPTPAGLDLTVSMRMPEAAIQLLANASKPASRTLVVVLDLNVGFGMNTGQMKASVQLDRLRAIESIVPISRLGLKLVTDAERNQQEYIIEPTNIHVAFLTEPSRLFLGHSNMTVDVGIETMTINIGYQQYLVIMGALAVMYPPKPEAKKVVPTSAPNSAPNSPRDSSAESSKSPEVAASAATPAVASAIPSPLHFSEQNIHVQVHRLQLNVLNDCYHNSLYLLRVEISHLLAQVHKFGDSGGLYAKVDLRSDYHNHRVMCWEPLIEPYDLIFSQHLSYNTQTPQEYLLLNPPIDADDTDHESSYKSTSSAASSAASSPRTSAGSSVSISSSSSLSASSFANLDKSMSPEELTAALTPFTDLNVTSSKPFNLNLSVAVMQDIIDLLALIKVAKLKPRPDTKFYSYPPYRVENHTNLDVEIHVTAEQTSRSQTDLLKDKHNPLHAIQRAMSSIGITKDAPVAETDRSASPVLEKKLHEVGSRSVIVPAYSERDILFPSLIAPSHRALKCQFLPEALNLKQFTVGVSSNHTLRSVISSGAGGLNDETLVITDVLVRKGVRIVSLHSAMSIGNQTDGELAIRTTLNTEHIIPRGQLFWLPLMPNSQRRQPKIRPYEALIEEGSTSMVGQERLIHTKELVSGEVKEDEEVAKHEYIVLDASGKPHKSRMLPPTQIEESQVLHHWSGEIVCDSKEIKQKRSDVTGAMHYRCVRESVKAGLQRQVVVAHQTAKLLHEPSLSPNSLAASQQQESVPKLSHSLVSHRSIDPSILASPSPGIEREAYNFCVYPALWKKREMKVHAGEEQNGIDGSSSSSSAPAEDVAASESNDSNTFGSLSKKKHCSIYYVRNTLTLENFLATKVEIRLYNNSQEVDSDTTLIDGAQSPGPEGAVAAKPKEKQSLMDEAKQKKEHLLKKVKSITHEKPAEPPRLVEEVTLHRGQAFPSHGVATHLNTFIAIRLPHLACEFTDPVPLKLSANESRTIKFHLRDSGDKNGSDVGALTILADVSVSQGHVHVLFYTHYWIFDLSKLSLLLINDETKQPLPRLAPKQPDSDAISLTMVLPRRTDSQPDSFAAATSRPQALSLDGDDSASQSRKDLSTLAADSELAALKDQLDVYEPVMFSSKHHESKKQRIRLKAGFAARDMKRQASLPNKGSRNDDSKEEEPSLASAGRLDAIVPHNLLGPIDEPSNYSTVSISSDAMVNWSDFSAPISMEAVGQIQSVRISQRAPPAGVNEKDLNPSTSGRVYELIYQVASSPGRFYRTKQITFAPRFIVVNKLRTPISLRQFAGVPKASHTYDLQQSLFHLDALQTQVFHWPHIVNGDRTWICVQREGAAFNGWNWSGFIDITTAGDYPMVVSHQSSQKNWFIHCEVRMGANGTAFIIIDEFPNQELIGNIAVELPYLIHNRSATHTIRFRQVRDKAELSSRFIPTTAAAASVTPQPSPYDWFEVPPRGIMPYIWEEPLHAHSIVVQFGMLSSASGKLVDWQKEHKMELDNAELEGDATMRMRVEGSSQPSASGVKIYWYHESSGPTQLLVFNDKPKKVKKTLLGVIGVERSTTEEQEDDMKEIPSDRPAEEMKSSRFGIFGSKKKKSINTTNTRDLTATPQQQPPRSASPPREDRGDGDDDDPTNQTDEDRRIQNELDGLASTDTTTSPHSQTTSNDIDAAQRQPKKSLVPDDFTSSGVLHLTVIGAAGFKPKRKHMYAGVVFNDLTQRTEVIHDTREPKWNRRMQFRTEIDSEDFNPKSCFCFSSSVVGTEKQSKLEKQKVFVNIYEKTSFSDHFLGAATVNLRDVGFEHSNQWFDVYKQKGGKRGMEKRGRVHLGLWWQQHDANDAGARLRDDITEAEEEPGQQPTTKRINSGEQPGLGADSSAGVANIEVDEAAPVASSSSPVVPRLHRMLSTQTPAQIEHLRELVRLTQPAAYQQCDASSDSVWSEYRLRILTTSMMRELAVAHQLDFLQGRLVAYVTSPLIPRGFSVLLMDHGIHNLAKRWKQDIHFAIPHHQATRYRKDAIVRITLFFFKSKNYQYEPIVRAQSPIQSGQSSPRRGMLPHLSDAISSILPNKPDKPPTPITGFVEDMHTVPLRIGECAFDLMSVREADTKSGSGGSEEKEAMEEEKAQQAEDAYAAQMAEEEEEAAAHASFRHKKKAQLKTKSKKQLLAEERDRQRKEWKAKWIPLVSSVRTPVQIPTASPVSPAANGSASDAAEAAHVSLPSLCLNVKRVVRERTKQYKPTTSTTKVFFPLFGISVIDSSPEEVVYLSIAGVGCNINDSKWQTTLAATITSLQLDNRLANAQFPVVFNPTIIQGETVQQPFLQVALNKRKTNGAVTIIPYFSVLMQKLDVRIEEVNIWRTLTFLNQMAVRFSGDVNADLDRALHTRRFSEVIVPPQVGTQKIYCKLLHVQPIALNVSFASNPGQRQSAAQYQINPFYTLLHMLEAGIGCINDAPLRLNGKLIENALGTSDTIVWSLVSHYIQQGVMEAYKIFGSVEFLGNPVGLANDLGTGTKDFFCEPARGLMISPEAFGTGLAKGSSSLVKGTIGGVMGAASAVTNSASKAMATASGDEKFMANQASSKQPEHVAEGLKMGVTALGTSLVSGVTGVFLDPLAGARKEGVLGFAKGLGKGVAGLVFKPITGVLDLTTNTLKGLGNTAGYLLDGPVKELRPFRPKRWIDPDLGIVTLYNLQESIAHDPLFADEVKKTKKLEEAKLSAAKKAKLKNEPSSSSSSSSTAPKA